MTRIRQSTVQTLEARLTLLEDCSNNSSLHNYVYKHAVPHLFRINAYEKAHQYLCDEQFLIEMHDCWGTCTVISSCFNIIEESLERTWLTRIHQNRLPLSSWIDLIDLFMCTNRYDVPSLLCEQIYNDPSVFTNVRDRFSALRSCQILYLSLADYDRVITVAKQILALLEIHPSFKKQYHLVTESELALAYQGNGEYDRAMKLLERLWRSRPDNYQSDDDYLGLFLNLANQYGFLGNNNKAQPIYEELKLALEEGDKTESELYQSTLHNLGSCYASLGMHDKSMELLMGSLEICRQKFGSRHSYTAVALYALAKVFWHMDEPDNAEPYIREAIRSNIKIFGLEHEQTISSITLLGRIQLSLGLLDEAQATLSSCEKDAQAIWSIDNVWMIAFNYTLFKLRKKQQKHEEALRYLHLCIDGEIETYGPDHERLGVSYWELSKLYKSIEDFTAALAYANKCFALELRSEGFSSDTRVTANAIVKMLIEQEQTDGILSLFEAIDNQGVWTTRFVLFMAETIERLLPNKPSSEKCLAFFEQNRRSYQFSSADLKALWKLGDSANKLQLHEKAVLYRKTCTDLCIQAFGLQNENTLLTAKQCLKDMATAGFIQAKTDFAREILDAVGNQEVETNIEKLVADIRDLL